MLLLFPSVCDHLQLIFWRFLRFWLKDKGERAAPMNVATGEQLIGKIPWLWFEYTWICYICYMHNVTTEVLQYDLHWHVKHVGIFLTWQWHVSTWYPQLKLSSESNQWRDQTCKCLELTMIQWSPFDVRDKVRGTTLGTVTTTGVNYTQCVSGIY